MKHNKLIQLLTELKIIGENGKLIPFSRFKDYATVHSYGHGRKKSKVVYLGKPKESLFAFYLIVDTDLGMLKDAYATLKQAVDGDMIPFNDEDIVWGKVGIPVSYRRIG